VAELGEQAEHALSLFASTSPSYLILQSLDECNAYLEEGFAADLATCCDKVQELKTALAENGYTLVGDEPLKIAIAAKAYGYTGEEVAAYLEQHGIVCEFADPDYLVMLFAPSHTGEDFRRLTTALCALTKREPLTDTMPTIGKPQVKTSLRDALFAPAEVLPLSDCVGRVLASPTVSCPPVVPVLVGGEVVDESAVAVFRYYGYETLRIAK
jgi:arginine/lysine/ornithine decarboxylase